MARSRRQKISEVGDIWSGWWGEICSHPGEGERGFFTKKRKKKKTAANMKTWNPERSLCLCRELYMTLSGSWIWGMQQMTGVEKCGLFQMLWGALEQWVSAPLRKALEAGRPRRTAAAMLAEERGGTSMARDRQDKAHRHQDPQDHVSGVYRKKKKNLQAWISKPGLENSRRKGVKESK